MSFRNNFFGVEFTMSFTFWDTDINNPDDYIVLGEVLNLTWIIIPAVNDWDWEVTFTEQLDSVDVLGGGWFIRYEKYLKAGDVSNPDFYFGGYSIVSIGPAKSIRKDRFITAFDSSTWQLLFLTLPFCGLTLFVSRKYARNSNIITNFCNCLWEICVVLCWDVIRIQQVALRAFFLYTAFMFSSFVLVSLYFAEFTAIAARPVYVNPPINTLRQFEESKFKWVSGYDIDTELFLTMFGHIPGFKKRHVDFNSEKGENLCLTSLKKVKQNPHTLVTFMPKVSVNNLEENEQTFYLSKETFYPSFSGLYFKKNSYFKEAFNRALLLLQAVGVDYQHGSSRTMSNMNPRPPNNPKLSPSPN